MMASRLISFGFFGASRFADIVVVKPYPFDESPLRVSVRGKLIPNVNYKSQEEFRETYGKAQRELFEFTLRAG